MKKKEKEHLKADPFVHFMQQALAFFKSHRRPLLFGAGAAALVALVLLAVFLLQTVSNRGENRLYAAAYGIESDGKLTVDKKIAALQKMTFRKGISAAGHLFLASLFFEKGDLAQAESVLAAMPRSRVALLNDEKQSLFARVLAAGGRSADAEAVLKRLLGGKTTAMAKERILLQLAKLQVTAKRQEEGIATLKRITAEYGETPSAMEARTLLASLEAAATPAD